VFYSLYITVPVFCAIPNELLYSEIKRFASKGSVVVMGDFNFWEID